MENGYGVATTAAMSMDERPKNRKQNWTKKLINYVNTELRSLGIVLFAFGVFYLTGWRYRFSFGKYSFDLFAVWLVTLGSILFIVGYAFIKFKLKISNNQNMAMILIVIVFWIFIGSLVLSVITLRLYLNDNLVNQHRNNMIETMQMYDELDNNRHETLKINWLQQKYNCCGLESFTDWKSMPLTILSNSVNDQSESENNRTSYVDRVPESCCIRPSSGCGNLTHLDGKKVNATISIYGCVSKYNSIFSRDLQFIIGVSTLAWVWCLMSTILQVFEFKFAKKNASFSTQQASPNTEEHRNFI